MCDASLAIAGVRVYVSEGLSTVAQLEVKARSSIEIIIPLSVLFLSPIKTLPVTRIGKWGFRDAPSHR
jgi:hypothetical protein